MILLHPLNSATPLEAFRVPDGVAIDPYIKKGFLRERPEQEVIDAFFAEQAQTVIDKEAEEFEKEMAVYDAKPTAKPATKAKK